MASSPPSPPKPVGEDKWIDYIEQQQRGAASIDQRVHTIELYRAAVDAEPVSLRIWIAYCEYFWALYSECLQRSGPVALWSADEQAAAASFFSLDRALNLWSEGHEATKYRISDSHELWNRWISLERELLDRTRTAEGVRRITHLYRNRLSIPHMTWDDTSSAFSSFLTEYSPAVYEETMLAVSENARAIRLLVERHDPHEMALRRAARSGDVQVHKDAMAAYLAWEVESALAEREDRLTAVRVALGLFSRALTGVMANDDSVWIDLLVFVAQLRAELVGQHSGAGASASLPDSSDGGEAKRNEELLHVLPNTLDILQRAVKHCPWSGALWVRYIISGEQAGLSFYDMEIIKHSATNSSLDRDGMTAVVDVYAAWCGYLSRSAMNPNAPDEAIDIADTGLVAALEAIQVWGERRFGSAYQGDPNFRLEHIMIQHLTDKHGAIDEAREQWEKLAAKPLYANDYSFWLSYYKWEMLLFQSQRRTGRSPTPSPAAAAAAAAASHNVRIPTQATLVLRRAVQNPLLNWPERIMEVYATHCNDHQSADILAVALDDVHRLRKEVEKRRRLEAQAQAMAAAAAAEEQAPASLAVSANEQQPSASPSSAKRKRETDAVGDEGAAAKRCRSDDAAEARQPQGQKGQASSSQDRKRDRENTSVYVSQLPADVTATKLRSYFREYGHVNNIQLEKEEDGRSAVALVEFRSVEDVQSALIRDGKYFGDREISVQAAAGVTLFVVNFPPTADEAYMAQLFGKAGKIFGIRWPSLKFNAHRRFCYVSFREAASAARAVELLDGKLLEDGRYKLSVKYSDPAAKTPRSGALEEGREVHVKNLGPDVGEAALEALFRKYGQVERVRLLRNMAGRSRGSAFVVLAAADQAARAVAELDKAKMGSQILTVELSVPAAHRPAARETLAAGSLSAVGETLAAGSPSAVGETLAAGSPSAAGGASESGSEKHEAKAEDTDKDTAMADTADATDAAPWERTFALLGIPDTVNISRVRALLEPHGVVVKLVLRADHGGAIVEMGDVPTAGNAQMALEGAQLDGATLRVGTVAQLFKEKAAVRVDRIDQPGPKSAARVAAAAAAASTTSLMPPRIKRPVLGGKGAKRGLGFPGAVATPAAKDKSGEAAKAAPAKAAAKKSNADFRDLFLGKKSEPEAKTEPEPEPKSADTKTADAKMEKEVVVNGHQGNGKHFQARGKQA